MINKEILYSFFHFFVSILDIVIVYLLVYRVLSWLKKTHAFNLIKGLLLLFAVFLFSYMLNMSTLSWVMEQFTTVLIILIIIIFQPELRRFLEGLGATGHLFSPFLMQQDGQSTGTIKQILKAVELLSKEKIGSLIVIEASTNLSEYIESGVKIQGEITSDLLASLFWLGSPTHDGAVIIRGNKIEAAGCLLPLTEEMVTDRRLGTRHRAAMGLSEKSDAVIIVVSEENGVISLVENAVMTRYLNREALETRLFNLYKEGSAQ